MRKVILLSLVVLAGSAGLGRAATVVVATDLPLVGASADLQADTNRAAQLLLEQAGGKAGPHDVTLRTYDNATEDLGGWSGTACRDNAHRHVAVGDEVAVMGPFNSGCAKIEVPILNKMAGGPLAMISGGSVYPGLVRPWSKGDPGVYYPTGIRSFGRVIPSDNWQADAAAIYARRLHITRCLIVHDGDVFGVGLARAFRAAARKQGIKITGLVRWKAVARNYKSLFKTAKAKHPDCVYLSGSADSNGARLLHDKVKYLGSNTKIRLIAPDGFLGYPDIDALKAARGMYVTTSGVTLHRIHARGGAGAAFIDAFKARFGHAPDSGFVLYGAAAYQLILDAVAASDGTHDDVRAKLFSGLTVPADRSVLGLPFGIDKVTGDATLKEITIVRLSGGKELDWGYVTLPS